jgi:hypothetical protein
MPRFAIIKAFKVILWLFSFSPFKLIFFSFFDRVTPLPVQYIGIFFFFMAGISYPLAWFFLGVFKAFEAIV